MALPRLNDNPQYDLVIPSTNNTVKYRPFLVKEQKVLMLAYESQNKKEIVNSIMNTIDTCVIGDYELNKLTTYDVDYIFTKIRSKSVGEAAKIMIACQECEESNEVTVNLDKIEVLQTEDKNTVKITDEISIKLRHPTYSFFMNRGTFFDDDKSRTDVLMDLIIACIDTVYTEEEAIKISDEPIEEVQRFLDSLTTSQFEAITTWVEAMPTVTQDIEFKCKSCEAVNKRTLKGLDDFF